VNVGWDIHSKFPREQVARSFYANVDPRLRELWKYLREQAASRGLGRVELLPLKYGGPACARYFTKYLAKAFSSEKLFGEERCRLFGVWGGVRFVRSRFSFVSSRIIQRKKEWFAAQMGYSDASELAKLSKHWWFHLGKPLSEVVMPEDFYKVGPAENRMFDDIGFNALAHDLGAWRGGVTKDLVERSQFNLLYEVGALMFGRRSGEALNFAMRMMAKPDATPPQPLDPQLLLGLEAAIARTRRSCFP
jgi:hypothetical protein